MLSLGAWAAIPRDDRAYYPASRFDLSDLPRYVPRTPVSGTIRIWGSGYIGAGNTTRYWEAGFRRFHPGVRFEYTLGESLNAVPAVYTGAADIGSGPAISWNDLKAFNHTLGRDPVQIMVMTGSYDVPGWNPAFVILVNKANPIAHMSLDQLDRIFGGARSGGWIGIVWHPELARSATVDLRSWEQLGLGDIWRHRGIHVYGANFRYGVSGTFSDRVLKGSDGWNPAIKTFTNRPDPTKPDGTYLAVEQIADAVAADPQGIGFSGVSFAKPGTKMIAIGGTGAGPFIAPTLDSVRARTYPLTDASYMFADRQSDHPMSPKVREFLRYILSREGQSDIARDGKFLPLTAEAAAKERAKLGDD